MTSITSSPPRRQAIAYVRVSTESQVREGISLDAQRARIQLYCDANQIEIVEWCSDEGISGKTITRRPGVRRAIERACELKATLIAYSLSRVSRSLRDMLDIAELVQSHGANLASLTEQFDTTTPMGRFVFSLFGALAQLERETISERIIMAFDHKRRQGLRMSRRPPYGWEFNTRKNAANEDLLIEVPRDQAIIRIIMDECKGMTDKEAADELKRRGIKYAGRKWGERDVRRVRYYQLKRWGNSA